jgi:hypothetical protein
MSEDKARDDKFINKDEPYEVNFILGQYDVKDQAEVKKAIEKGKYQSHDEIYNALAQRGIKRKS